MPRLDGHALAERIRAHEAAHGGARLPIVAITANVLQDERERCLRSGMDAFLTKPVQMEALRRLLSDVLSPATVPVAAPCDAAPMRARLLAIFVADGEADLVRWQAARRAGDQDALRSLAHKLKAGSMLVGEGTLTACLQHVEAHAGSPIEMEALAANAEREFGGALRRARGRRKRRPA